MDFLKCNNCNSQYDLGDYSPKSLPCGHSLCKLCCEQIISPQSLDFACLSYRSKVVLEPWHRGPTIFSAHHRILMLLLVKITCSAYKDRGLDFVCSRDYGFLCAKCAWDITDHRDQVSLEQEVTWQSALVPCTQSSSR